MDDKERSDATTSGQVGPKYTGLGLAPTSRFFTIWPEDKTRKIASVATEALLAV